MKSPFVSLLLILFSAVLFAQEKVEKDQVIRFGISTHTNVTSSNLPPVVIEEAVGFFNGYVYYPSDIHYSIEAVASKELGNHWETLISMGYQRKDYEYNVVCHICDLALSSNKVRWGFANLRLAGRYHFKKTNTGLYLEAGAVNSIEIHSDGSLYEDLAERNTTKIFSPYGGIGVNYLFSEKLRMNVAGTFEQPIRSYEDGKQLDLRSFGLNTSFSYVLNKKQKQ